MPPRGFPLSPIPPSAHNMLTVALVAAEVMPGGSSLDDPEGTRGSSLEDQLGSLAGG